MKRKKDIILNLEAAGCRPADISCFMKYYECTDLNKETNLLDGHRRQLLGDLHAVQKQIDCLDYLVYELKKENINE